jgi:hypothetical protein
MASKLKVDAIETGDGTGTIALSNQFSGMTVASLPTSGTLPALDGSVLTNLPGGGKILQIVSTEKSDTFTSTSTSFVDITGFSVAITPTATSSKILVMVATGVSNVGDGYSAQVRLLRGSTAISIGDASSSRTRSSGFRYDNNRYAMEHISIHTLDSPSTTSATTYKMQLICQGSTGVINRSGADVDASYGGRTSSSITVMEIGA